MADNEKIKELEAKVADRENDIKFIAQSLLQGMLVIGIDPAKNKTKKDSIKSILKALPRLMNSLMTNPAKIERDFAFITEMAPLFEKYAHLFPQPAAKEIGNGR